MLSIQTDFSAIMIYQLKQHKSYKVPQKLATSVVAAWKARHDAQNDGCASHGQAERQGFPTPTHMTPRSPSMLSGGARRAAWLHGH